MVLEEENLTEESLLEAVGKLYENRETYRKAMQSSSHTDSIRVILQLIDNYS